MLTSGLYSSWLGTMAEDGASFKLRDDVRSKDTSEN